MHFFSFSDFKQLNSITYGTKNRSLVHELVKNYHQHLLGHLQESIGRDIDLNQKDCDGFTPLLLAFSLGMFNVARTLMATQRVNIDIKASQSGGGNSSAS